jgi:guanylate kinase
VQKVLASGKHVIMDIDVQGARQFVASFPESVLIFILPPSAETLIERLEARGTEDRESLIRRFRSAKDELKAIDLYPYVVVNDEVDSAVAAVSDIIDAEGLRRFRNKGIDARVTELMDGIQRAIDKYSVR